ncbi:FAD-dependent monooxygenase [Streptomyces sp. NPDC101209]|uniref:FAD-dependent monooxygenase n=1 Tax=Streptomyces sp. NPDC101209 TaxID=3366129 RepID=UPI0037F3D826
MPGDTIQADVVVVGAGPVGLMLAGELIRGGVGVVLVEKRRGPHTGSRASTLHARTMELLHGRGLVPDLGDPPREPRGHFGGIPLDLTLPSSHPGQWKVPQTKTEAVLEEWVLAQGAELRCKHELTALEDTGDGVEGTALGHDGVRRRLRARYLVACDGEDSTVRRLIGADFPGQPAGRELLRADVAGLDIPDRRFERLEGGLAIAARRGDGVTRVMVHEFGSRAGDHGTAARFEDLVTAWKKVTGEDISHGTPLWVNSFTDASRQLTHYRHGRILFAGDAAHQQMPIGGQALNLGLQDAVNLGWKLALHLRGRADATLLDTYHTERHAVGRQVLANIRAQALLLLGPPSVEPLRRLLGELIALEDVRARLAGTISGLGLRYDLPGPAHPLLGARLPATPLRIGQRRVDSAHLLRTGGGVLLDLRADLPPLPLADGWTGTVGRVAAVPEQPEAWHGADRVLLRPDGHIAWAGTGEDRLGQALRRWFGPPR